MKKPKKLKTEEDFTVCEDDNTSNRYISIVVLVVYLFALIFFSLLPGEKVNETIISSNSITIHYFGYFFLTIVMFAFFLFNVKRYTVSYTLGLGILISIFTEIMQNYIPGRNGNILDFCVNLTGLFTIPIIVFILAEIFAENEDPYNEN